MKYLVSHERYIKFEFQCPVDKNLTWDITEPIIYEQPWVEGNREETGR